MNGRPRIDHICGTTKRVIRLSTGHRVVASSSRGEGRDPGSPWRHGTTPSGVVPLPLRPSVPALASLPSSRLISSDDGEIRSSRSRDPKLLNYFPIAIATDAGSSPGARIGSGIRARPYIGRLPFGSVRGAENTIPRQSPRDHVVSVWRGRISYLWGSGGL